MIVAQRNRMNGGFLVLTMVLLVSAAVLIIVTGVLLRSIGDMNESSDSEMSLRAMGAVNACGEYALGQMASTTGAPGWSYAGGEALNIPLPDGADTCYIYPVEEGVGGTKLIKASSTVSFFTKKIRITVATNTPSLAVSSWEEMADF